MLHHIHRLSLLAACAGFIANIAQVALFRFFMGQFYGTEIHLGMFLSIWLLGIAIGSFAGGKVTVSPRSLLTVLFALPLLAVGMLFVGSQVLPAPDGGLLPFAPVAAFMLVIVTPISLLIGMLVPCLIRLSHKSLGYFYSLEAIGGFAGGVFFSLVLGGKADAILCLMILPLLPLAALTLISSRKKIPAMLTLLIAPAVWHFGPMISHRLENTWWKRQHNLLNLEKSVETPYQKLQLAGYYEQKSLFSNGLLACSWPEGETAEARAHVFATSLAKVEKILLIGAPTSEFIDELLKYEQAEITIVESDAAYIEMLGYKAGDRITAVVDDPRRFLNNPASLFSGNGKYDGIMICPISPVTLVGNRLFTVEAFAAMRKCLNPGGVISLQVEGSENYLGSIKEKIILSTWQALKSEFACCTAFPGSTITFFASQVPVSSDPAALAARFAARHIPTACFQPLSFHNILMPFRIKELNQWLGRNYSHNLNTDAHPCTFMQQLELWNIYSGTAMNELLKHLQATSSWHLFVAVSAAGLLVILLPYFFSSAAAAISIITAGVTISGASGLLCEIILILLYQNRFGAAYQMTALFFGLYMLGLATGSKTSGHIQQRAAAIKKLKQVKLLQIIFTGLCMIFVDYYPLHSAPIIGMMIFLIAYLDGIEFPVSDSILRGSGRTAPLSAGLLLCSDSAGAMIIGASSGLWLLPAFGMRTCFALLCLVLLLNYLGLLLFSKKIHAG